MATIPAKFGTKFRNTSHGLKKDLNSVRSFDVCSSRIVSVMCDAIFERLGWSMCPTYSIVFCVEAVYLELESQGCVAMKREFVVSMFDMFFRKSQENDDVIKVDERKLPIESREDDVHCAQKSTWCVL